MYKTSQLIAISIDLSYFVATIIYIYTLIAYYFKPYSLFELKYEINSRLFTVISTQAGLNPLFIAFRTDLIFGQAAQ